MKRYLVSYEVRNRGAIGAFTQATQLIHADSLVDALKGFRDRNRDRWEFRCPVMVIETTEKRTPKGEL